MAGGAVPQRAHQVGAAVPLRRALDHRFVDARREEQRAPDGQRGLQVVGEAQRIRAVRLRHRQLRAQPGVQRVGVGARDLGEVRVREHRVQQVAVGRAPVVHRAPELRGRPGADAGLRVRREVARVDRAERRGDALAAGERRAAAVGVAGGAVAGARQVGALPDLFGRGEEAAGVAGERILAAHVEPRDQRRARQQKHYARDGRARPGQARARHGVTLPHASGSGRASVCAAAGGRLTVCDDSQVATAAMSAGERQRRDLGHAVGRERLALAGAPAAELLDEVAARQAQQAGDRGQHARHRSAVALHAGRDAPRGVALAHQAFAARDLVGRRAHRLRRRVGQVLRGEVVGDLVQVGVGHLLDEVGHRRIGAAPAAEVVQLVVQVAGRLAGDAREVALLRGPAFLAMAGRAGLHALGHGVRNGWRRTGHCSGHAQGRDAQAGAPQQRGERGGRIHQLSTVRHIARSGQSRSPQLDLDQSFVQGKPRL